MVIGLQQKYNRVIELSWKLIKDDTHMLSNVMVYWRFQTLKGGKSNMGDSQNVFTFDKKRKRC